MNRLADKWTPLFGIAKIAGGDWPEKVKKALYGHADLSEPSKALELLQDVKKIVPFNGHIFTENLIDKLCVLDDAPWAEYNFKGWNADEKRISSRQLSYLLKKYGLKPKTVKIAGVSLKGYKSDNLQRAFKRYIPNLASPPELAVTPLPFNDNAALSDSGAVTPDEEVTDNNTLKPSKNAGGNGVTGKTGVTIEKDQESIIIR